MIKLTSYLALGLIACSTAIAGQTTVQVRLESSDGRRASRQMDRQISRVRLLDRLSTKPCTAGQDWGYSGRTLWVDDGCRGVFEVQFRSGTGTDERRRTVTLGDSNNSRKRVWVGRNARIQLVRTLSKNRCVRGSSWGYDGSYLWVRRGCRAQFAVYR
jgi:hypothetical protein